MSTYQPIEEELIPKPLTHQLKLWERLISFGRLSKYTSVSSVQFYVDNNKPDAIIAKVLIGTWMKWEKEVSWRVLDERYLEEGISSEREAMLPYYERNHIDAPSIGLYHSQYHQDHPLYRKHFAMITAWNPNNQPQSDFLNREANDTLRRVVESMGYQAVECVGYLDDHSEEGFVIPDIGFEEALELGRKFGQYSIFYNRPDRWGYYESIDGYPIFFTTRSHQKKEYEVVERKRADKKAEEAYRQILEQRRQEKIAKPIDLKRKIHDEDMCWVNLEKLDHLIDSVNDGGYGMGMMMASQGVPREVIMQQVQSYGQERRERLRKQGFDSTNEKLLCILLRSHRIASPKPKAKAILAAFESENRDEALYEALQNAYGAFGGADIPKEVFELLYVLQQLR